MKTVFSSESVTEGHPDKTADKISDAILDAHLKLDPESRVACETLVKTGAVVLAGEITSRANVDYQEVVRTALKTIGYDKSTGFDYETCAVINMLSKQSPDISQGVTAGQGDFNHEEQGAGDQGLMFGLAINDTPELMPLPILLAQKLTRKLTEVRKEGLLPYLKPDGKSQVAIAYDGNNVVGLENVVLAAHHSEEVSTAQLRADLEEFVIKPVCGNLITPNTKFFINATGRFVVGGPVADAGLTGRKIIVDTYGGWGRHGGGAFSGKDPSKVDRSAAYAARYIAKNIVAAGLAYECEVQLAYCIGRAEPTSINCNLNLNEYRPELTEEITKAIYEIFPVKPADIIKHFGLKNPVGWSYFETAAGGHFGREQFPWERTDKVEELKEYFK
ncbi:MAG: methionine adenosyltransferase [Nanoarchaeota archaeon]